MSDLSMLTSPLPSGCLGRWAPCTVGSQAEMVHVAMPLLKRVHLASIFICARLPGAGS